MAMAAKGAESGAAAKTEAKRGAKQPVEAEAKRRVKQPMAAEAKQQAGPGLVAGPYPQTEKRAANRGLPRGTKQANNDRTAGIGRGPLLAKEREREKQKPFPRAVYNAKYREKAGLGGGS